MRCKFKFRDGRERDIDPNALGAKSNTPLKIRLVEPIERGFDLQWHDGKPVYVERGSGGESDDGPLGGLKAAIVKFLRAHAEGHSDSTVARELHEKANAIERNDHLRVFLEVADKVPS